MKKAILTCGLFSLMMVLTSFTSTEIGGQNAQRNGGTPTTSPYEIGGQNAQRNGGTTQPVTNTEYEIGGQNAQRNGGTQTPTP